MKELESKVIQLINEVTGNIYESSLKIIIDEDTFILKIIMNQKEAPLCFCYQGNESGFLRYLEKDLRNRQLEKVGYYKLVKTDESTNEFITIN